MKKESIEGTIHVCAHHVKYSYWDMDTEITEELKERLEQEAEDRAKSMIIEGNVSGELNCVWNDQELRGWWKIL